MTPVCNQKPDTGFMKSTKNCAYGPTSASNSKNTRGRGSLLQSQTSFSMFLKVFIKPGERSDFGGSCILGSTAAEGGFHRRLSWGQDDPSVPFQLMTLQLGQEEKNFFCPQLRPVTQVFSRKEMQQRRRSFDFFFLSRLSFLLLVVHENFFSLHYCSDNLKEG